MNCESSSKQIERLKQAFSLRRRISWVPRALPAATLGERLQRANRSIPSDVHR